MEFLSSNKSKPFHISNVTVQPGERITLALQTPELYSFAPMYIPIHVVHGKKAGPTVLVCATMHGDEINGISTIQKLLNMSLLKSLSGTLIAIPVINVYGLMVSSRNLPDKRDLDGSFPGSSSGTFSSRLAHTLTTQVLDKITHCIDLRTGEPQTESFAQVLVPENSPESLKLAQAFNPPVIMEVSPNHGMLWLSKRETPVPSMIYEVGEALRLDRTGIRIGLQGIVSALRSLDMLPKAKHPTKSLPTVVTKKSKWVYAHSSGLCELSKKLGAYVDEKTNLAKISDPFGSQSQHVVRANTHGIIVARSTAPIVNEGDAIAQIAEFEAHEAKQVDAWGKQDESKKDSPLL